MVRRGLVESRTEAQEAISQGLVTVDGAPALKAARQVDPAEAVAVAAPPRRFVSRGGEKLLHGLESFGVSAEGRRCLDAGVSTGGFTDCLLQHGAAWVLAVDVGYGQVHERIRTDERVEVRERTNIRDLTPDDVPEPMPDLVVCDVSFIALTLVLPHLRELAAEQAEAIVLCKPQFEAERDQVGKGGVVRDPDVWAECLHRVAAAAGGLRWAVAGIVPSSLLGPAGNVEFLVHLQPGSQPGQDVMEEMVQTAVKAGLERREAG